MALPDTCVRGVAGEGAPFPSPPPPPPPLFSSWVVVVVGEVVETVEVLLRIIIILLRASLLPSFTCLCLRSLILAFKLAHTGTGQLLSLHSCAWVAQRRIKKLQAVHFPLALSLQSRACLSNCFILMQNGLGQLESRHEHACMRYSFLFFMSWLRASIVLCLLGWSSSPPMEKPNFSNGCSCLIVVLHVSHRS